MIGTHAPKFFNAKLQQPAMRARVRGQFEGFICSATTDMRRELWALPRNAANITVEREMVPAVEAEAFTPEFPGIEDSGVKQLLVPQSDWRDGKYLNVSPVSSCGVMYEVFQRLKEQQLPWKRWVVQPTSPAIRNHGETLLLQGGRVRLLMQGCRTVEKPNSWFGPWRGEFVQLTARAEAMNISGGMVSLGWPAITAIGGLVHAIERKTGIDLQFAFGMTESQWHSGVPKQTKLVGKKQVAPTFSTDEIFGSGQVVLLLRTAAEEGEGALNAIADALASVTRLAGGRLVDISIRISSRINGRPVAASYLIDGSNSDQRETGGRDALDDALKTYGEDWKNSPDRPNYGHSLNMVGYAHLEDPVWRKNTRDENYPHVWAEPVFSLVHQGWLDETGWWERVSLEHGTVWQGVR